MTVFSNHVIIITGSSEGIGRALALALAPQRPNLVLAARNPTRLEEVRVDCERRGAQVLTVPTDVTNPQACANLIHQTVETFNRIDALVNNAGLTMWATFEETTDLSIFDYLMQVNYLGSVYCTKHALPYLKQSKGRLVAVSSVAGLTGVPTRTGYCASKFAMMGFFEALRIELAGTGVSVTIVAPDFVQSKIHERALGPSGVSLGENPLGNSSLPSSEACARMILSAMEKRTRLLITSRRGRLGRWGKLIMPRLIDWVAQRAVKE